MTIEYYEGTQYTCNKLGYENKIDGRGIPGGYWIYLLGNSVRIETSDSDHMPVWNEHFNRDDKRDEIDALVAWRTLCRSLVETEHSLRFLIDMHCRIPYNKPPIANDQWSEANEEHDLKRLSRRAENQ